MPVAAGKNAEQLQRSASGSGSAVCAIPLMMPRTFFTGHSTTLFGPPSVPRSVIDPSLHSVA